MSLLIQVKEFLGQIVPFLTPTKLDPKNQAADRALLGEMQGNIVQPHGRPQTTLWFFRFPAEWGPEACRRYLQEAAPQVSTAISAWDERVQRRQNGTPLGTVFRSLGLTSSGIRRAAVSTPEEGHTFGRDFSRGMGFIAMNRTTPENSIHPGLEFLDPVDATGTPTTWDEPYLRGFDGVWIFGHLGDDDWRVSLAEVQSSLVEFHVEYGATRTHEPFGFRDGLVRHAFFRGQKASSWFADLPLKQLLIQGTSPHARGSFLVLRKLEQNVRAFREFESAMERQIPSEAYGGRDPGALLVGRTRDGTPLAKKGRFGDFDFVQDRAGTKCPFHAHIRKANPRGTMRSEFNNMREAQFVRRSVVYDPDRQLDAPGAQPERGVGLLFMGYMAEIGRQFLVQQKTWLGHDNFPVPAAGAAPLGKDPLLFGGKGDGTWRWQSGGRDFAVPGLREFVRPKGGAYFYVPTVTWLANPR